ncbi:MAG: TlpA family protein disulfide reductase [Pseudomonadota bacterium]|nr:TlpA family protein disulfide reductase [Pseudomonadota bacterium]
MRPLFLLLIPALLAGCDTEPAAKGGNAPPGWTGPTGAERQGTGRLDRSHAGTPAPNILFEDPAGEPASIADFRGKPVLVNLWATWCGPCVVEMPSLDALAARDPHIQVLALSQDMNGQEKVDAFFAERKFAKLEPYIDAELSMMSALKVDTLPTTILYDSEGQEVWRMTGREDWTGPRAAALIEEAGPISPSAAR